MKWQVCFITLTLIVGCGGPIEEEENQGALEPQILDRECVVATRGSQIGNGEEKKLSCQPTAIELLYPCGTWSSKIVVKITTSSGVSAFLIPDNQPLACDRTFYRITECAVQLDESCNLVPLA